MSEEREPPVTEACTTTRLLDALQAAEQRAERAEGERDRLREDVTEYDLLVVKLSDLLTRTANALKGEPDELTWHDWSDLPEVATDLRKDACKLVDAGDELLAKATEGRTDLLLTLDRIWRTTLRDRHRGWK